MGRTPLNEEFFFFCFLNLYKCILYLKSSSDSFISAITTKRRGSPWLPLLLLIQK